MREQLIEFQTAKLAKEKGFIGYKSKDHYRIEGENLIIGMIEDYTDHNLTELYLSAPSQSLLQRWLREVHGIHIFVSPVLPDFDEFGIGVFHKDMDIEFECEDIFFSSYELALEVALKEGLKLVKK